MKRVFENFLRNQEAAGLALAAQSDVLELRPLRRDDGLAQVYIARFTCRGLVRLESGQIATAERFDVAIRFADHHLRQADSFSVLTWMAPAHVWHPNINGPAGKVCAGERLMVRGVGLVEILYQLHAIITYQKWAAHNGLNRDACQWARNNQRRFPVDARPLKRRRIEMTVESAVPEVEHAVHQ